jgi:hypothetical protein
MGFSSAVIPTAPLNEQFTVELPLPAGSTYLAYKFNITEESMVKFNRTIVNGADMSATLVRIEPDGTVHVSTLSDIELGSSWIRSGLAEDAYNYAIYMPQGTYGLMFYSSGISSVALRINTYPITSYTPGTAFGMDVYTTRVLGFDVSTAFEYTAFNVTLLSELNASMNYRITLYDDYDRYIATYNADGGATTREGIGNRQDSGTWQGVNENYYDVDPSGSANKYFHGNMTAQQCLFVPTYAGRYFLVVDFRFGYNTTTDGLSDAERWRFYEDLTVSLRIDLSPPDPTSLVPGYNIYEVRYVSLDSSSGSASTTVTYDASGGSLTRRVLGLKLTPQVNTWTRVSVSIINGTSGGTTTGTRGSTYYERIFDKIRYATAGQNTFDSGNDIPLFPDQTYYNVTGLVSPRNVTYTIEFGALMPEMMIRFLTYVYINTTALHTVVTINVSHYSTPVFSGLRAPPSQPVTGSLVARIVDSSTGAAIADASVVSTSQPAGQAALDGLTNSTGYILFSDILPGAYNLNASKIGYNSNSSVSVTVVPDVTTSTQISLSAIPGQPTPFPLEIVLIVVAVVAVALIVIFVAVRKKSKKS